MVKQSIWIGITIGLFFAGLGIGYAIFSNSEQSVNPFHDRVMFNHMMEQNNQAMSWMMDDSHLRQQMFQQMIENSEQMREWIANDPRHIKEMTEIMKEDHMFMSQMMTTMMNDPDLRFQMIGHMAENPEALREMMIMWGAGNMMGNNTRMSEHMMNP